MDQQINQDNLASKKYLTIIISVAIVALIVSIGFSIWQQFEINKIRQSALKEQQLLNTEIETVRKQLMELQDSNNQNSNSSLNNENELEKNNATTSSGLKVEVVNGIRYCESEGGKEIYQKILQAVYLDGTKKILYATDKDRQSESNCSLISAEGICCLKLSPNEKYLFFSKTGWEWSKPYMLNIETGKYVFGDETEINNIYILNDIKWSADNNNFIITSDVNELMGIGEKAIYVSAYNNPDIIKKIWSIKNNYFLTDIKNISFMGNDKLVFDIEQREIDTDNSPKKIIKYQYDYKQDKLSIIN